MKKVILLLMGVFLCFGCDSSTEETDVLVYSTVYPVTYLLEELYGDNSVITSIYPDDADIDTYDLTDKQKSNYSQSADIFVYLGVTDEKNLTKDFINENNDLLIIDAAHSLSVSNSVEELWLSPNNYLMVALNIKDSLTLLIDNQYVLEEIEDNYNYIYEVLSLMDADLRKVGSDATDNKNNTLVVSSDAFLYLESYGFNVISLEDENYQSDEAIALLANNFEDGDYLALITEYEDNDVINSFIEDNDAQVIYMNTFYSSNSSQDYMEALNNFIYSLEILID